MHLVEAKRRHRARDEDRHQRGPHQRIGHVRLVRFGRGTEPQPGRHRDRQQDQSHFRQPDQANRAVLAACS